LLLNKRSGISVKKTGFFWQNLLRGFWDILYPKVCLVCRNKLNALSIDELVCLKCWGKIKKNIPPFCRSCGRTLDKKDLSGHLCSGCAKHPPHFDRAFSPCVYEGPLKELIHQFKYKKKDYLGPLIAGFMAEFIREYAIPLDSFDLIIPIPLHPARLREREFNQALILSDYIAGIFDKKVLGDNLIRCRHTRTQTDLKDQQRFINVKESFAVKNPGTIRAKNILLIDDVMTTGATSSEAAFTLKDAGAGKVFVLTLAS
jgi:ComF family protein